MTKFNLELHHCQSPKEGKLIIFNNKSGIIVIQKKVKFESAKDFDEAFSIINSLEDLNN